MPLKKNPGVFFEKSPNFLSFNKKNKPSSVFDMRTALIYWCQTKYVWVGQYFIMEKVLMEALPTSRAWTG